MTTLSLVLWRLDRGFNQQQLAELSDIPRPNLSRIERGLTDPTLSTLSKIARALGLSVSALLATPPTIKTRLTRHQVDKLARSIINGERTMGEKLNCLADQCAALMTQKLAVHSCPGYARVSRLKADHGLRKAILFAKYDAGFIGHILERTKKSFSNGALP